MALVIERVVVRQYHRAMVNEFEAHFLKMHGFARVFFDFWRR